MRQLGVGAESAQEIKLFGLIGHLAERFGVLADRALRENTRRARCRVVACEATPRIHVTRGPGSAQASIR